MSNEYEETMNKAMDAYRESVGQYPTGQDLNTLENLVIKEVESDAS